MGWTLFTIKLMMGREPEKNNFKIVEMRWYEDVRYNRNLRWVRGENEEIICKSIGRDKLRWEYSGNTHETSTIEIDSYQIMTKDNWVASSPWYENMCSDMNGDKKQIAQELDVSFITSGGNVVDEEYIEFHEKNNVIDPKYMAELEKSMWIWREPEEDHKYIMGVDVSRGDGADSSTIVILDFEGLEEVAEFQYKLPPGYLS